MSDDECQNVLVLYIDVRFIFTFLAVITFKTIFKFVIY